jgi:hypothetical protein
MTRPRGKAEGHWLTILRELRASMPNSGLKKWAKRGLSTARRRGRSGHKEEIIK